jgi:S4 domain protein YaaA
MDTIKIQTDHITLGQFLKYADLVPSGGMVKWALEEYDIFVNDVAENRRGRKLVPGDRVVIKGVGSFRIGSE